MAQHANPIGIGISEFERAQLSTASTRVVKKPSPPDGVIPAMVVSALGVNIGVDQITHRGSVCFDSSADLFVDSDEMREIRR